jgi:hypothetical protein
MVLKKTMKRIFFGLFLFITALGGWYLLSVHWYNEWFNSHLISTVWTANKGRELNEILSQPFHYCGQGSESKAYVSEDGQFIIKTFLKRKFESKKCKHIPLIRDLENKRRELKVKYERSFGPINAYQYIPKESGMIYYQFIKPTNLFHKSLQLTEKDGSISKFDLDKEEYIIQKKAVIVSDYFLNNLKEGNPKKVKSGLKKLLELTKNLYDQGIVLIGLQFLDNFGFIDDEPIRIDVAHIRFDPRWKDRAKARIKNELENIRPWIVANTPPEIVEYFEAEIKLYSQNF